MRQSYEARPPFRPILTVQYPTKVTPSDLDSLEAIVVRAHNTDGSFVTIPGYDDPTVEIP